MLHDTVEDTLATIDDIETNFGADVARLVDGVTKLSKIEQMPENERAAENLRKFLLAMSEDIRVLLVKLGDRLHNMRTLHFIKMLEKRQRIARETMDIYAPLAERVGMYEYMREMQLLAFEQLEPDAFRTITKRLEQLRAQDGGQVDAIALAIKQALAEAGFEGGGIGPREAPLFDLAQDGRTARQLRTGDRHHGFPRHHRKRGRLLPRAWACCTRPGNSCRAGSRTISRRPRPMAIARCTPR